MSKLIYYFGNSNAEGNSSMHDILGNKGANLAQMCKLGLPVPSGFTIATSICSGNKQNILEYNDQFESEIKKYLSKLERDQKQEFGSSTNPLFISVRSGASISMPGMMDTILNLGMNDNTVQALANKSGNLRFAYDSYRRFLAMYGNIVLGISSYIFEEVINQYKEKKKFLKDSDISVDFLIDIVKKFKQIIQKQTGKECESNPYLQLKSAIKAVWRSWNCERAINYRRIHSISDNIGTAVNIQSMVFGNIGNNSATGVVFTRNPSHGENEIFGEFLINAQGVDIVSGTRTPLPVRVSHNSANKKSMQEYMPKQYNDLVRYCKKLEKYFQDMQDIEFTIQEGQLYILQTRNGKRTATAAIKIAVDMVSEGIISRESAIMRIDPESLHQILHTGIDYTTNHKIIATGLPASPGASTGIAVFSPYDVEELSHKHKVILIRNDTSSEDIKGMHLAGGIITARGGMTSHAAVVARGMGKPCVCGVKGLIIDEKQQFFTTCNGHTIKKYDQITVDGTTGNIIIGNIKLIQPQFSDEVNILLEWSDNIKDLDVRANAETIFDAALAVKFGAVGIGLCRTEHMFFDCEKLSLMREIIITQDSQHRTKAIEKLKPLQTYDFKALFEIMNGMPVNIRLLDPPLHEFLPTDQQDKESLAKSLNLSISVIENRLHSLHEINPMLGHRGCRLGISFPEIYTMQIEAILLAIKTLKDEKNIESKLELMIPFISDVNELITLKKYINETINTIELQNSIKFNIKLGAMIELPRSALTADKIAKHVQYFSFGSNDLTQTTHGMSRDDIGSFLPDYMKQKIFENDPFVQIDIQGVGELIKIAINKGKKTNDDIAFGICGEHAGDPSSIDFFHKIKLNYISCSAYRIPIARIAAAKSKLKSLKGLQ